MKNPEFFFCQVLPHYVVRAEGPYCVQFVLVFFRGRRPRPYQKAARSPKATKRSKAAKRQKATKGPKAAKWTNAAKRPRAARGRWVCWDFVLLMY